MQTIENSKNKNEKPLTITRYSKIVVAVHYSQHCAGILKMRVVPGESIEDYTFSAIMAREHGRDRFAMFRGLLDSTIRTVPTANSSIVLGLHKQQDIKKACSRLTGVASICVSHGHRLTPVALDKVFNSKQGIQRLKVLAQKRVQQEWPGLPLLATGTVKQKADNDPCYGVAIAYCSAVYAIQKAFMEQQG
jgi:hypothetical protein